MYSGESSAAPLGYCTKCGNPFRSGARFCSKCGAAVGPPANATIATSETAGTEFFIEALKVALEKNSSIPAIPLLQKALTLGIAPENEVHARLSLGEGYREIVGNCGLPWQKMVEMNEFDECLIEI